MSDYIDANGHDNLEDDDLGSLTQEKPGNFEQVPHALWHKKYLDGEHNVSPQGVVAYLALSKRGGESRVPKRKTLAEDMGCAVRTVDARLDELVEKGWLLITPRFRKDGPGADARQTSNHYHLCFEPIRSEADPRFQAYLKRVAAFEAEMAAKQDSNRRRLAREGQADEAGKRGRDTRSVPLLTPVQDSARGPVQDSARGVPSNNLHGALAESCTGPVQEVAPQDKDPLGETPSGRTTAADATAPDSTSLITDDEGQVDGTLALEGIPKDEPRPETPHEQAYRIAREYLAWVEKETGAPVVDVERKVNALKRAYIDKALKAGATEKQIKSALAQCKLETLPRMTLWEPKLREAMGGRSGPATDTRYRDDAVWGAPEERAAKHAARMAMSDEEVAAEVAAMFQPDSRMASGQ